MTYRRRYFPYLDIPTNEIQDLAITEGKIDDGAVTGPKLATGSVSSDILADNAVTPPKIPAASITGSKIASGTIDTSKLAFTIITRPFSVPISTVEIADGAITAPKLAAGGITGATIADRTITGVKLALDTITGAEIASGAISQVELADDAVGTDEIQTNAVTQPKMADDSVGTPELIDDAVTTGKIINDAVTTAKIDDDAVETAKLHADALAKRHLLSFKARVAEIFDHFVGAALSPQWAVSGDGGFVTALGNHYLLIRPKDAGNKVVQMDYNNLYAVNLKLSLPTLITRLTLQKSQCVHKVGWNRDANDYVYFRLNTALDTKLRAVTASGGVETVTDTLVSPGNPGDFLKLTIEFVTAAMVKFYINDILVATHTTNITDTIAEPYYYTKALDASAKNINIDYIYVVSNPVPNITP
jgi:hypothetical protein